MKAYIAIAAALVLLPASAPAAPELSFSAGQIGVTDDLEEPEWYGIELRWSAFSRWAITPGAGVHRAACGANFVYMDFRKDFALSRRWTLSPHFGPGVFHDSDQVQLGYDLQFRSGLELNYRLAGGTRFGVGISHLSNGSLGRLNPGTEAVSVTWSMPLS